MTEGATTWALVVGIDEYDEPPDKIPHLKGAAADAVAAVEWLRKLGVPDSQILLHARPSAATRPRLDALGMTWMDDAREATIWGSVARLLKVLDGTRLFVFLSGHGVWEPTTGRCFLTQESGHNEAWRNLGIDLYINCFLSSVFPRQFLIMDGCLNLPYTTDERQKFGAVIYSDKKYTPEAGRWLIACFGASFGERTFEVDGRGAFTRRLLERMNPNGPERDGMSLDFKTGVLSVDMQKVMSPTLVEQVRRDVRAQAESRVQTPNAKIYGDLSVGEPSLVYALPTRTVVRLQAKIDPVVAAADVDNVHVEVDERPWWGTTEPLIPGDQIGWPVSVALPADMPAHALCQIRGNAPWAEERIRIEFTGKSDQIQEFKCVPRVIDGGGGGPPAGVDGGLPDNQLPPDGPAAGLQPSEQYSVKVVTPQGYSTGVLLGQYDAIESALGLNLPDVTTIPGHGDGSPWLPVSRGIEVQRHESGPEFRVQPDSFLRGRAMAAEWAQAISKVIPDDYGVVTVLRGNQAPAFGPNLRLVMPKGGADVIAGPLVRLPTVRIGPPSIPEVPVWRSGNGRTLQDLEDSPTLRVDPGPVEIRIDLPWGSWSTLVAAPDVGPPTSVRLPRKIGDPPLRCPLKGQPQSAEGYVVYGTTGRLAAGRIGVAGDDRGEALHSIEPHKAKWALAGRPAADLGSRTAVVHLGGPSGASFPILRGRPVAVELTKSTLRAEPLSDLVSPEWDLLVATGRLDAITSQDAINLTGDKWFDSVLGLAGAYAVYASAGWNYLQIVTGNLGRVEPTGIDVDLLAIAARRGISGTLSPDDRQTLTRLATSNQVPLFRWGVALARDLLSKADLKGSEWDRLLDHIGSRLSPVSVWTAWRESKTS